MSWDKNTVSRSDIDTIIETLKVLKEPYTVTILGEVMGLGLNDGPGPDGTVKMHMIRKLEYRDKVVLEQMQRYVDCDTDDCILSFSFDQNNEPKDWPIEVKNTEEYTVDDDPWDAPHGKQWNPKAIKKDDENF